MVTLRSLLNSMWSQGAKKPYQQVINVSSGDPQGAGVKPLTFVRQVTKNLVHLNNRLYSD